MATTHVRSLEHGIHQTNVWLGDVAAELDTDDRQYAAQLAAQLPDLAATLPQDVRALLFR